MDKLKLQVDLTVNLQSTDRNEVIKDGTRIEAMPRVLQAKSEHIPVYRMKHVVKLCPESLSEYNLITKNTSNLKTFSSQEAKLSCQCPCCNYQFKLEDVSLCIESNDDAQIVKCPHCKKEALLEIENNELDGK